MNTLSALLVREIEQRAAAIEQALWDLSEAEIWTPPAPTANAAGNLVLHLCGNLMKYVALGVGGLPFERDRPGEFNATGIPRRELLQKLKATLATIRDVFARADDDALRAPYDGAEFRGRTKFAVALHAVEHFGYHTGQIVLSVKVLRSRRPVI